MGEVIPFEALRRQHEEKAEEQLSIAECPWRQYCANSIWKRRIVTNKNNPPITGGFLFYVI